MRHTTVEGNSVNHTVLVADTNTGRRQKLARPAGRYRVIEAASLVELYPLAEDLTPQVIALEAGFLLEPDVEGVVRLAEMIGSRVIVYSGDGRIPINSALRTRVQCVPLMPSDSIDDLLNRRMDPRAHLAGPGAAADLPDLILIGASTGGVAAIEAVLASFPANCPPTLVVQHIRGGFVPGLVQRLNGRCRPRIVEASDGERLQRGTVYFAGDSERHLVVSGRAVSRCTLIEAPPCHGHRPAVDPLFESAVSWGGRAAAALLTGMGTDGALGLGALRKAGACTIAQDRATSIVWGMPRAAAESGAAGAVLALDRIGPALLAGHTARAVEPSGDHPR